MGFLIAGGDVPTQSADTDFFVDGASKAQLVDLSAFHPIGLARAHQEIV